MNSKIFVNGLPYSVTDAQLHKMFASHGIVKSARVITDWLTGRSRGFGFVEMATAQEAQAAIVAWNGAIYEGRTLLAREAKPQMALPSSGHQGQPLLEQGEGTQSDGGTQERPRTDTALLSHGFVGAQGT